MADLSKTVEIIFGMDDRASGPMKGLAGQFKEFDTAVQTAAQPLAAFGAKLLVAETAVLGLAAAFVGKAIGAAGQFGDSVREIGTLFGGTSEQVGKFGTDIQNYAATSTQSIESINGAVYEAISSGVKYEDSLAFINDAEKLAVAGRADLTQVTDVLTGTLNAYGASTSEAANYTDDLLTAVNLGKTTVPELASSLAQVTSIAAAAGVPFSDLSAAVAGVTAAGKPTAEAVTAIRGVLETFVSPSGAAAKAAAELGISLDTTTLKSKGLDGALRDIYQATGGTVEGLSSIFTTTEGLQGALILGADKSGIFAKALQEMETNAGTTAKAYEIMSQNFEVATQRMANAADVAMIKAGQPLLDEFGGVANGIAAVFNNLGKSIDSGAFDPIINALETFGKSAADTLQNIAANLPAALEALDFSGLIDSLGNLGGSVSQAFEDIFGNIDLNTPEGLASALQTIVNGITALTNVTAGIVDSFEPIFVALGELAKEAGNSASGTQEAAGQFIGIAQQIVTFGTGLTAALTLFNETGTSIIDVVNVLSGGIKAVFNAAQIGIDLVAGALLTTGEKIAQAMALITFGDTSEKWKAKAEEFGTLLDQLNTRVNDNVGEMAQGWEQFNAGLDGTATKTGTIGGAAVQAGNALIGAADSGKQLTGLDWGQSVTGVDYVGEAAKRLGISFEESGGAVGRSGEIIITKIGEVNDVGFDEFIARAERLESDVVPFFNEAGEQIGAALVQVSGYVKTAADDMDIARAATNGYKLVIDDLGNRTFTPVIEAVKKTKEEIDKSKKAMEDAAKAAVDYDLKLREIESKERIAYIEAKFKVDEAQIKADADRVAAAFSSINVALQSTGETLTSLVGSWASLLDKDRGSANELWTLIQTEEKRRQAAFDQQKILLDAQIEYMKARTRTLERGDTLIKVNADGVAPELEKIFHEILRRCQVKANEQGLELLLAGAA